MISKKSLEFFPGEVSNWDLIREQELKTDLKDDTPKDINYGLNESLTIIKSENSVEFDKSVDAISTFYDENRNSEFYTIKKSSESGSGIESSPAPSDNWVTDISTGEYFPDTGYAKITKRVYINHWVSTIWDTLEIKVSNPDEEWSRTFKIFVDGVERKSEVFSGTSKTFSYSSLNGGWWFSAGNTYEITFQIAWGAFERGWSLDYAKITWSEGGANAIDYVSNEVFPVVGTYRTIYKTSFVQDTWTSGNIYFKMKINNPSQWSRYIYIYNNDQLVGSFIAGVGTYTYIVALGSYVAHEDFNDLELRLWIACGPCQDQWILDDVWIQGTESWFIYPWDLTVAIGFDAGSGAGSEFEKIKTGIENAAEYLWDAMDAQGAFRSISISNDVSITSSEFVNADIRFYDISDYSSHPCNGWPCASGGGINNANGHIYLGRYWDGGNQSDPDGTWDKSEGYRTIIHEFGHYGLWAGDEYKDNHGNSHSDDNSLTHYQYTIDEFCSRQNHNRELNVQGYQNSHEDNTGNSVWEWIVQRDTGAYTYLFMMLPIPSNTIVFDSIADYVQFS